MLFLLPCLLILGTLCEDGSTSTDCTYFFTGPRMSAFFIYGDLGRFNSVIPGGNGTHSPEPCISKVGTGWNESTAAWYVDNGGDWGAPRYPAKFPKGTYNWHPTVRCFNEGAVATSVDNGEHYGVVMGYSPNTFNMCAFFPGYLYNSRDHLITGASSMRLCAEYALTYGGVYYVAYDVNSKNCIASRDWNALAVAEGKGGNSYVCQVRTQPFPGDPKLEEPKELGTASSYDDCFKRAVTKFGNYFDMAKWNPKTQDCTCGVVKKVSHNYPEIRPDAEMAMLFGWNPKLPLVNSLATITSTTTSTATSTTGNLHSVSTTTTTPLTFDSSVSALSVASKILTFILPFVAFF